VTDHRIVEQAEAWIDDYCTRSRAMTIVEATSWVQRWLFDPVGRLVVRLADALGRLIASRKRRRTSPNHSLPAGQKRSHD
jgi:hypothetical protein